MNRPTLCETLSITALSATPGAWGEAHLAVVSFSADQAAHVLLVQRGRDAKAVAHAQDLHPVRVADLHGAVDDHVPQVQLRRGR